MKSKFLIFILTILAALCMCVGFTACEWGIEFSSSNNNSSNNNQNQGNNSSDNNQSTDDSQNNGDDSTDDTQDQPNTNYSNFIISGNTIRAVNSSISGAIVLPSEYNGNAITTIPANAFKGCANITSIKVPASITSIGAGAFSGCSNLESITLPFVGSNIGNYGLQSSLFGYIFGTTIYDGATKVEQYIPIINTFYVPDTLKKVTITNETVIGRGAFQNCSMLTDLNLNENIEQVGISSFENCDKIKAINLPNIKEIPSYLFSGCSSLIEFTVGNSVDTIDNYAFSGCSALSSVEISEVVRTIGNEVFRGCSSLTSVTVPDSVTIIGEGAFSGCSKLESIVLPFIGMQKGNNRSAEALFGYIFGKTAYEGGTAVEQYSPLKNTFYIPATLRSVTITRENVIGHGAFQNCTMLTTLKINASAQNNVDDYAFDNISTLPIWTD